jgi:RimJ/RimL family protein N-acetyltransferase
VVIGLVGFNQQGLASYEKAGFKRDGYFYDHRNHDFVMMSILEDVFRAGNS